MSAVNMTGKACTVDQLVSVLNSNNAKVIEALTSTLQPLINETLQKSLADISGKLEGLAVELKSRDEKIRLLQKENTDLRTKLNNQEQYVDQIETYTKQDNLIIHGLPADYAEVVTASTTDDVAEAVSSEKENSTTTEVLFVKFCADRLGVDIRRDDISICHRLKKLHTAQYPPVIVRFTNRKARAAVLAARNKLRPPRGIASASSTAPVYINEHLTKRTSQLFAEARKMAKNRRINNTWTYNGRVMIKLRNETICMVNSLTELEGLV